MRAWRNVRALSAALLAAVAAFGLPVVAAPTAAAVDTVVCDSLPNEIDLGATREAICAADVPLPEEVDVCEILRALTSEWSVSAGAAETCLPDLPGDSLPAVCALLRELTPATVPTSVLEDCLPDLPGEPTVPDLCELVEELTPHAVYSPCEPPPDPCDLATPGQLGVEPCDPPPPPPDVCEAMRSLVDTQEVKPSWSTITLCLPAVPPVPPVPPAPPLILPPVPFPPVGVRVDCPTGDTVMRTVPGTYLARATYFDVQLADFVTVCQVALINATVPFDYASGRSVTTRLDVTDIRSPSGAALRVDRADGTCSDALELTVSVDLPGLGVVTTGYGSPLTPAIYLVEVGVESVPGGQEITAKVSHSEWCTANWTEIPVRVDRESGDDVNVSARFSPMPAVVQAKVAMPDGDSGWTAVELWSPYPAATSVRADLGANVVELGMSTTWGTTSVDVYTSDDEEEPFRLDYTATRTLDRLEVHYLSPETTVDAVATNVPTGVRLCFVNGVGCDNRSRQFDDFGISLTGNGRVTIDSLTVQTDDSRVTASGVHDVAGLSFHQGEYWQSMSCFLLSCEYGDAVQVPACAQQTSGRKVSYLVLDTGSRRVVGDLDARSTTADCSGPEETGVVLHSPSPGFAAAGREMHWATDPVFDYEWPQSGGELDCPGGFGIDVISENAVVDYISESVACT